MVDLAMLQVDERRLGGLLASARRDGISVRSAFVETLSKPLAELTAEELQAILQKHEFGATRVTLVIPRRFALVRELNLPPGSSEELSGMIRFQLSKELPVPIEEVQYCTQWIEQGPEQSRLLAMIVPDDVHRPIVSLLLKAGIRVSASYLTTQGLAAMIPAAPEPTAAAMISGDSLEFLIEKDNRIRVTTNVSIEGLGDEEIGEQLNRAIMSHLSRTAGTELTKILLTEARPKLVQRLMSGVSASPLDMSSRIDGKAVPPDLMGAAGVAVGLAAHPGEMTPLSPPPAAKKKFELRKPLRLAGMGVAILILGIVYLAMDASDREDKVQELQKELQLKNKQVESVRKLRKEKEMADLWGGARPQWPETLLVLSNLIDTHEAYLTGATFDDEQGMTLQGRARRREVVTALVQKFEESRILQGVGATNMTESNDRLGFGVEFTIKARVEP